MLKIKRNRKVLSYLISLTAVLFFIGIDGYSLGVAVYADDFGGGPGPGPFPWPGPGGPGPGPCEPSPGVCCGGAGGGGKVIYFSGVETFSRTDLEIKGVFPITLTRKYNSQSQYDSPLGYGWSHNHDFRIYEYPDNSLVLRSGCGIKTKYTYTAGTYQRQAGSLLANITTTNGEFTVSYLNGEVQFFDTQGRMLWWQDVNGNRLEYTYNAIGKLPLTGASPYSIDPSQPMTVAFNYQLERVAEKLASGSLSGNYIDFTYHPTTGRLISATSNDGRTITYSHDVAANNLTLGNLTGVIGLEGLVSTYQYDDKDVTNVIQDYHNITSIQEGSSTPYLEKYDEQDRVIRETYGTRIIDFDYQTVLLNTNTTETVKDDLGVTLKTIVQAYEFGVNGFVTKKIDGEGNETQYQRNALGLIEREEVFQGDSVTGVSVKRIDRTYFTNGRINTETTRLDKGTATTTDDETVTTTWTYDDTLETTKEDTSSVTPTKIFKTEKIYNHDGTGRPTTIQLLRRYKDDGSYLETSFTYNANGNVLTTTYPDGHVVENEYGAAYSGRYVTKTFHRNTAGATVPDLEENYQYDNKGNRTHVTDAEGNTTITTYDDKNRRKTVTNAKNHLTTFVYDVNGNLMQINRDRSAVNDQLDKTKLTYNSDNRLIQIDRTDDVGAFVKRSTMRYDSAGNVIAHGDANGIETTLIYDLENRLTRITDSDGNYIEYTLNALGHRLATNYYKTGGILVRSSSAVFDDLDRQQQIIGALNQTTTYTYDAQGNRITATDALHRPTTVYSYDTLNRLTNIKDANAKDTGYQYDDRDQLRYVTDPIGLVTEYQYNELGQLTKLISPDTSTTEYTYDLVGNRQTQKDARNITVTFVYDELNRVTSKTYADTSLNVTYTYDAGVNGIGRLSTMTDKEGVTTYGYDERGNLISRTRTVSTVPYLTQYGYDLNDRLTSITYPSGRVVNYVRNNLGQVTSVTTTPSGGPQQIIASNISYLPFGALEDMGWGNGLSLDQTFDDDYRLTNQVLGTVYNRTYAYDLVNNIKSITDSIATGKSQSFIYDILDRLDEATGVYGVLDYAYDDVGNRTSLTKDAGAPTSYNYSITANQLDNTIGTESHSFTYDANGNTETKDGFTFSYDQSNRMQQVSTGAVTTSYGFNGKGERTRKTTATATTLYHYDNSGNLLFETDATGNVQVEYIWLGNQRLAMVQGGALYYTHVDHLGTVQLLTNSTGNVVWSADYKPFGEVTVTNSIVSNNLRFPGQYYDAESGLHYNYFRDYDPAIGRYIEVDPLGLKLVNNEMHLGVPRYIKPSKDFDYYFGPRLNHSYEYGNSNPLSYIDPLGLSACTDQCDLEFVACLVFVGSVDILATQYCLAVVPVCPVCPLLCLAAVTVVGGTAGGMACDGVRDSCTRGCPCE